MKKVSSNQFEKFQNLNFRLFFIQKLRFHKLPVNVFETPLNENSVHTTPALVRV